MKINVKRVLDQAEARKTEEKPLPKVKIRGSETKSQPPDMSPISIGGRGPSYSDLEALTDDIGDKNRVSVDPPFERQALIDELQADLVKVKKDRAVLSSQTWKIVQAVVERLEAENPNTATAFIDGKLRVPELEEHAGKIEALTDQGARIYDDLEHVKQHGKKPNTVNPIAAQATGRYAKAINYEIRRLDDRIHKTRKKVARGKPKNPLRVALWNQKIAFDEAQRDYLKHELKKLQYGSRAELAGTGEL